MIRVIQTVVCAMGACIIILTFGTNVMAEGSKAEVESVIKMRQQGFKKMGSAMKTLRTELKSEQPDFVKITAAVGDIVSYSDKTGGWFPVGSGPESGLETAALAGIWEKQKKFNSLGLKLKPAADKLLTAVNTKDANRIVQKVSTLKKVCSNCHLRFRAED